MILILTIILQKVVVLNKKNCINLIQNLKLLYFFLNQLRLKLSLRKISRNIIAGETSIITQEIYAGLTTIVDQAHFFLFEIVHLEGE